jgi:hypothetical protein
MKAGGGGVGTSVAPAEAGGGVESKVLLAEG